VEDARRDLGGGEAGGLGRPEPTGGEQVEETDELIAAVARLMRRR
jgi:hypothetical protein